MSCASSLDTQLSYGPLGDLQRRGLAVFYRSHGSKMNGARQTYAWVAKAPHIVAALCLTETEQGFWLTGLMVDPAFRSKGVASRLLGSVRNAHSGPIWLFCKPELTSFYQHNGYQISTHLPDSLQQRLTRYQQSKTLIAMCHSPTT